MQQLAVYKFPMLTQKNIDIKQFEKIEIIIHDNVPLYQILKFMIESKISKRHHSDLAYQV